MAAVPLLVSFLLGLVVTPSVLEHLRRRGAARRNHRGLVVVHPAGLAVMVTAAIALAALAALGALGPETLAPETLPATIYVLGIALLGLVDDLLGHRGGAPRGLRGHGRALARGRLSTGAVKAAGTAALSLGVAAALGLRGGELPLAAGVLTLAVHVFNLLDLRAGRSIKALLLVGGGLTLGSLTLAPLAAIGVALGAVVAVLGPDLRERAMLGDTGAGAVGAVAGLWIVLALPVAGQAVALVALAGISLFGELRSISTLVESRASLRRIDSLGRCG